MQEKTYILLLDKKRQPLSYDGFLHVDDDDANASLRCILIVSGHFVRSIGWKPINFLGEKPSIRKNNHHQKNLIMSKYTNFETLQVHAGHSAGIKLMVHA